MHHEYQPQQERPAEAVLPDDASEGPAAEPTPPRSGPQADEQVGDNDQVDLQSNDEVKINKLADAPQIWVGSWLDYNNGVLHGQWIDAARDDGDVWADIQAMLAASPTALSTGEAAEDWGIFDYDNFGPLKVGEQETISFVTAVARGIAEHGPAFAAWADVVEDEAQLGGFTDAYLGEYDSLEAYADQLVDDLGYNQILDDTLPEHVRRYVEFDVGTVANDLRLSGDVYVYPTGNGGVWLFDGR